MEAKALNTMLDMDIVAHLKQNIFGVLADYGKSAKVEEVDVMARRVLTNLKYKQDVMNITTEMVDRAFLKASNGEFTSKLGVLDGVIPANIVKWISTVYYTWKQENEIKRKESLRREFDEMCKGVTSPAQPHPVSTAASWLIRHSNDAALTELYRSGLTHEMVYELSYNKFNLNYMFELNTLHAEYKLYYEGLTPSMSNKLSGIVKRNNAFEMAFITRSFADVFSPTFPLPITKEIVAKLDSIYIR